MSRFILLTCMGASLAGALHVGCALPLDSVGVIRAASDSTKGYVYFTNSTGGTVVVKNFKITYRQDGQERVHEAGDVTVEDGVPNQIRVPGPVLSTSSMGSDPAMVKRRVLD